MSAAINAMRVLTDPAETGAVTLCLPQDVQAESYDYPGYFFARRVHRLDRRIPVPDAIAEAVSVLRLGSKPLLICGGGVRYSGAADALRELSEQFAIPFVETQAGKSAIISAHPFNLGGIGETGSLAANEIAKEADVVIGVGTRYSDFTTGSKWLFQNPRVRFININVSAFDAGKLDGVQIVADAKLALQAVHAALAESRFASQWGTAPDHARQRLLDEVDRVYGVEYTEQNFTPEVVDGTDKAVFEEFIRLTGSKLTQSRVLGIVNERIADNAVVVAAAGSLPGDLQRAWRSKGVDTYHVEYGYSCMGYEVNAALGVKLAEPSREVYALVGDGSYQMLHSELITSLQERRKINVILFDNMGFGCINNLQMGNGMDSFVTEFRYRNDNGGALDGAFMPVDYAMSAAAYGCKSYRVKTVDELLAALEDSAKQNVSTLIDIKVLPKTMIHGYGSWWRVGVAETSTSEATHAASERVKAQLKRARPY